MGRGMGGTGGINDLNSLGNSAPRPGWYTSGETGHGTNQIGGLRTPQDGGCGKENTPAGA
jgi:hypothetical protein